MTKNYIARQLWGDLTFLMKRAFIILIMSGVGASLAFAQNDRRVFDIVKLPDKSFIYPDTFAVYWKPDKYEKEAGVTSIKLKYGTMFDDVIDDTDFMEDSIIGFMFGADYEWARTHAIQWDTGVRPKWHNYYNPRNTKQLTILSRDDEIEALRALVENAFRWQNLKLLADAYERRECFVNAYYVYAQLLYVDEEKGRRLFLDFLSRNKLRFGAKVPVRMR